MSQRSINKVDGLQWIMHHLNSVKFHVKRTDFDGRGKSLAVILNY